MIFVRPRESVFAGGCPPGRKSCVQSVRLPQKVGDPQGGQTAFQNTGGQTAFINSSVFALAPEGGTSVAITALLCIETEI